MIDIFDIKRKEQSMSNQEQTSGRVEKCCQKLGRFIGEYAYKVLHPRYWIWSVFHRVLWPVSS